MLHYFKQHGTSIKSILTFNLTVVTNEPLKLCIWNVMCKRSYIHELQTKYCLWNLKICSHVHKTALTVLSEKYKLGGSSSWNFSSLLLFTVLVTQVFYIWCNGYYTTMTITRALLEITWCTMCLTHNIGLQSSPLVCSSSTLLSPAHKKKWAEF